MSCNAMDNTAVAKIFSEMADALEILGENRFRILAYRKAADVIARHPQDVTTLEKKTLLDIPGIGFGIAKNVIELATTGACVECTDLRQKVPSRQTLPLPVPSLQ